ncbi:ATP-binding cassette sub-family C member 2-like isoform X2 [Haemaphysalis longicornis]
MADTFRPAQVASFLLKCSPLVILGLFGGPVTSQNNYPLSPGGPYWTLLDFAHMALLLASAGLAVAKGSLAVLDLDMAGYWSPTVLGEVASDFAMAISLVVIILVLRRRWKRCLPPSGFVCALLGLLLTASVLDAFSQYTRAVKLQEINTSSSDFDKNVVIISFVLAAAVAGNLLASELQDLVLKRPTRPRKVTNEDTASVINRQTCLFLYPLLKEAVQKGTVVATPLPLLRRCLRCTGLVGAITARLSAHRIRPGHRRMFVMTVMKVLWIDLLRLGLTNAAYFACLFARIPALELLINSCSDVSMTIAVLLFAATTTMEFLISCYQMDVVLTSGCRARSIFVGIIFRKVTAMSAWAKARYTSGYICSMLGVDCVVLCTAAITTPTPLFGAMFMPFIFWMLASRAGVGPTLCCAAWLLLVLSLPFLSSYLQKRLWKKATTARDDRLKETTDLLSTIRVVKMYAWEDAMQENVLRARKRELKWLLFINILDSVLDSIYSSSSSVLMIILFSTIPLLEPGRVLTPALSFSCVSLLYMTDLTMNMCGQAVRNFSQASLALKRIADFWAADEQDDTKNYQNSSSPEKKGTVVLHKCSFAWTPPTDRKEQMQIADIELDVAPGSLVGIVGFVGSGKSSLLAAILGDMHLIKGNVECTGRIAFVPQLPNVHNMTIKDNILYGKPLDTGKYERVLRCCQLMNDLNKLHSGDMTEVGEKGTNLSGGQKQRISLARALYSESDVYLLDDPLSALDPVVGSRIFREVIGKEGLLKNKTRIMVCNQGHYLHHMDKLVVVDGKNIRVYDKLEDLLNDPESPQNFREVLDQDTAQDRNKISAITEEMEENDAVGRITEEEFGASTKTGGQLMYSLLRRARWSAPVGALAFVCAACAFAMEQLVIKEWTDATAAGASVDSSEHKPPWVQLLVLLCVLDVALRILGSVLLALTTKCLSKSLHSDMLNHVLQSPVSFFDASPRGRILNRFSSDMETVDARSFLSGKQSLQNTLVTFAKVAVVGTQSPVVVGITAIAVLLVGFGMSLAVKASHHARYCESLALSRLLQHVTETMDALSSVRAYGVAERFRRHFCRLTDEITRGYSCFGLSYRFTRTLTATAGFAVVMCTLISNTVFSGPEGPDPSGLGLALSSATSMVVAFERCVEYTKLPPESDVAEESSKVQALVTEETTSKWPSEGRVEFRDYSASYRPGVLPNVLNGVTFSVKPKEKVGVVGRTGAGKSSLVLALLRMLRPSEGQILIDGVDIANVPLRVLRRSITVIPQDPSLVRGTLRMNLDPTNSHSDREVWQCVKRAHLEKVVSNDPRGLLLETADGGTNLSVGQRQLVCLARALLRGSKILLLDEATSQMDGDTDRLIQVALRDAFAHCTLFTIAHRIHTVLDYDRILVLEDGKVKEFDTVTRLLADPSSTFYSMALDAGIHNAREIPAIISTNL